MFKFIQVDKYGKAYNFHWKRIRNVKALLLDNDATNKTYLDILFNAIWDDHVNDIASLRKAIDEIDIKI